MAAVNPPTNEILRDHELAHRTITQHNTDLAIFDQSELNKLKRFVNDPTPETQHAILSEMNSIDPEGTEEKEIGQLVAKNHGSLAGYVIARYGKVPDDKGTLNSSEVEALREWFANGGGQ